MQMQQTMSKSAAPRGELRTCALRCGDRDVPESINTYQIDSKQPGSGRMTIASSAYLLL